MGKFMSLKYDFTFKQLFQNELVRRHFISDVLGIPLKDIRSTRLANTFLWRRYWDQKLGILDVLVELNDSTKINVELQIKGLSYWAQRSLFYLAKMYTDEHGVGEKYKKLKKCICISVLGFNMDDGPKYHKVYRLRDEEGHEFSDMLEMHVIELRKPLKGTEKVDEWIRLFNVETEEELDMLRTKTRHPGILEAIEEVKTMNLSRKLRIIYDARMKQIWDREAREDYVRNEGMVQGIEQGLEQGEQRLNRLNLSLIKDKRYEDLERAARDKVYREQLYKEYSL